MRENSRYERNNVRSRTNSSLKRKQRKRRKRFRMLKKLVTAVAAGTILLTAFLWVRGFLSGGMSGTGGSLSGFIEEGGEMLKAKSAYQFIDEDEENADVLKDLLDKNPETADFVKNYAQMKGNPPADTIGDWDAGEIPLLLQWDERWGYCTYGDGMIAVNGCGPTCVSMVLCGLLGDPSITPYKVAEFAQQQGYYAGDAGTSWTLMSEGVQSFGIWGEEIGLSKEGVFSALESGNPVICSMRPGDFTTTGHFIVLTKVEDGKLKVNDPNSRIRSGQLWDYERLEPQIQNLWVFSKI